MCSKRGVVGEGHARSLHVMDMVIEIVLGVVVGSVNGNEVLGVMEGKCLV